MEAKSFEGLSGLLRKPSPWLAGEDLNGLGDVEVMIEDVLLYDEVSFEAGRKEQNVPALKFKGKAKQMILRAACNRKTLVRKFGTDTKKWRGQTITLYFDPSVTRGRETVGGLRIK
jgi:hypothetical protein